MFQQLGSITQEQTKTMSMITTQLKELTNTMTGTFMLLQQIYQRLTPFSYQQYGVSYVSPSPPMMPVPQPTHQFTTPVRRSAKSRIPNTGMYDSQSLFGDEN